MNNDEILGTFVRQGFYVDPPSPDASAEEWEKWMEEDDKKARVAKAQHTRARNELSEESSADGIEMPSMATRKGPGGRYVQGPSMGFVGDSEDGGVQVEPAMDPHQEKEIILADWQQLNSKRGTKSKGRNARRRANRRKQKARRAGQRRRAAKAAY